MKLFDLVTGQNRGFLNNVMHLPFLYIQMEGKPTTSFLKETLLVSLGNTDFCDC
jgi:hypothetical protein